MSNVWKNAFEGKLAGVKTYLKKFPDKKEDLSSDFQSSILYGAARGGHLEVCQFLVDEMGCDVDRRNGENLSTPLHGAAFGGHFKVVQYLVDQGAQLLKNVYDDTPLDDVDNSSASESAKKKCRAILKGMEVADDKKGAKKKMQRADSYDEKVEKNKPADLPKDLNKLTVTQLRAHCSDRGLATGGKKADLIARLKPDDDDEEEEEEKPAKKTKASSSSSSSSPPPAKKQKPNSIPFGEYTDEDIAEIKSAKASLEEIDKDTEPFWEMEEKVASFVQGRNEDYVESRIKEKKKPLTFILTKAQKIKNPVLKERYERRKKWLQENAGKEFIRERTSFHGTAPKNVNSIIKTSLLRFKHPLNPCKSQVDDGYFGTNRKGVYVSRYCDYTFKYSNDQEPLDAGDLATIIMFKTLPGKSKHIDKLVGAIDPTKGFHSHSSPSYLEWYLFSEDQLLPEFVLTFKAVEDTRTAADDE